MARRHRCRRLLLLRPPAVVLGLPIVWVSVHPNLAAEVAGAVLLLLLLQMMMMLLVEVGLLLLPPRLPRLHLARVLCVLLQGGGGGEGGRHASSSNDDAARHLLQAPCLLLQFQLLQPCLPKSHTVNKRATRCMRLAACDSLLACVM